MSKGLHHILKGLSDDDVLEIIHRSLDNSDSIKACVEYMLEELDNIRVYDEAMASPQEAIPFEQAVREIEDDKV